MKWLRPFRSLCIGLACLGLMLPHAVGREAQPAQARLPGATPVYDVGLDPEGALHGFVVDAQGAPVAGTCVVVRQTGREVARALTDASGRFWIRGLQHGAYQVATGPYATPFRAWSARTAPPHAKPSVRITLGREVVRAQRPLSELCCSDTLIITGLIAAMIAVPVVIHQSNQRAPSTP